MKRRTSNAIHECINLCLTSFSSRHIGSYARACGGNDDILNETCTHSISNAKYQRKSKTDC